MEIIKFTSSAKPFGWMGNMCGIFEDIPLIISFMGKEWKCTETLFQALRFDDLEIQELIRKENGYNGKKVAKKFSDKMSVRPLSKKDVENMILCIQLKVSQHKHIAKALIETGGAMIIEDVSKRMGGSSLFWGSALVSERHWIGLNVVGRIWYEVRQDLISGRSSTWGMDFIEETFSNKLIITK